MQSRTKTEDMPALRVEGAGEPMLEESARYLRHRHQSQTAVNQQGGDFTDDEPTVPGFRHNKEG